MCRDPHRHASASWTDGSHGAEAAGSGWGGGPHEAWPADDLDGFSLADASTALYASSGPPRVPDYGNGLLSSFGGVPQLPDYAAGRAAV